MARTGDMIHEGVCCIHGVNAVTHTYTLTHTETQVKLQIPRGLLSALHTRRVLISGCWLTPFNRILLVLGFLCSVEDTHGMSPERMRERGGGGVEEGGRKRERWVENEKWGFGCSGHGAQIKSGIDDTSCKTGFDFTGHFQPWWEMTLTWTDALGVH